MDERTPGLTSSAPNSPRSSSFLGGLAYAHPEMLSALPLAERQVLGSYYWFGRDIDVDDIFEYRRALATRRPELKREAERMPGDFFRTIGVTKSPSDYPAWS